VANEQQPAENLSAKGAARRRFTRAGAAASGVLLTLHSQPGMAATVCASPSGFLSGNLRSQAPSEPVVCLGRTPGYWKQPHKAWPAGIDQGTLFRDIFPTTLAQKKTYGSDSCNLEYILTPRSWDSQGLGRHIVAAYLNVMAGWSSFQNVQMLVKIWNEWVNYGYYTPTAGVKWYAYDIVKYLKATMPL